MSDTAEVKVKKERRVRSIPAIVLDRPALRPARMVFGFFVGALVGGLLGLATWFLLRAGPEAAELPGRQASFLPPYALPFTLLGVLAGLVWAFLEGRTVTPRRSTIEIEVSSGRLHRRSHSTALERRG